MKNWLTINWDIAGSIAALICMIHCALLPLLISYLPLAFSSDFFLLEIFVIALSTAGVIWGLYRGYVQHHKDLRILIMGGVSFITILLTHFLGDHHLDVVSFTAAGGLFVAHILNFRACRNSKCECHS